MGVASQIDQAHEEVEGSDYNRWCHWACREPEHQTLTFSSGIFFDRQRSIDNGVTPTLLDTSDLKDFEKLDPPRQKLIETAFTAAREVIGMPYLFGANGAKDGGFDCSGAMYHVLKKAGLNPPLTSSALFLWVKSESIMHMVSAEAKDLSHASLSNLKASDLVFWSGTYILTVKRLTHITHGGMFIGYEKKDGRPVMINASNGRSYRGILQNGFGVNDFRIPQIGTTSIMVSYGTPQKLK